MRPRDLVARRFLVERRAGSGGMGTIWRARDETTGLDVALKVTRARTDEEVSRFHREAAVLAGLEHPAIVRYLSHGVTGAGELYLAMEWLEGESLGARLRRQPLSVAEAVGLATAMAQGLALAHDCGVVHRDVKPSNIICVNQRVDRAKLIDFGIARLDAEPEDGRLTRTGAAMGTPGYMSPEQARGERGVDARADVFALGCVLFHCLTGHAPFRGEDLVAVLVKTVVEEVPDPRTERPTIPKALSELLARMLAKAPDARPADASVVAAALVAIDLGNDPALRTTNRPAAITSTEQRVLCVVLARVVTPSADPTDPPPSRLGSDGHALRDVVERHGGSADVLVDGSTVVSFMTTGAATDLAARAARCALAIRAALPRYVLSLATGIAQLTERRPVGDVIDRAAALLRERGSESEVSVDEATASLLDARFEIVDHGRGTLLRRERDIGETTRTLLGRTTPCVGRERELSTLRAFLDECTREPISRAVLVTADAGVGKSRLHHEIVREIAERRDDVTVWVGRGDPMSVGSPFSMIAAPIRIAVGLRSDDPPDRAKAKLRERLARDAGRRATWHTPGAADVERIADFLGVLLGLQEDADESVQLRAARADTMLLGDQMRRAFEDFVAAACAVRPVLLVLEDLHWGDLPSVKFVDAALRTLHEAPLMVLALARPEVHKLFPQLWRMRGVHEIRLDPLGRKASERLVKETLGDATGDETLRRLVTRAAGNAFYLEELIREVACGRGDRLPESVLAMVQARLEGLEPEARRVLRAASIFGEVSRASAVATLLAGAETPDETRAWLESLASREVLARRSEEALSGEPAFAFRHALFRDAAYATLTDADKSAGHRLAAEWLERAGEKDALVLAEHLERGGEPLRAAGWYRRAAEQALEGNDLDGALSRADRGVTLGADGEALGALRLVQAEACRWRGELAGAQGHALEAMQRLPLWSDPWCCAAAEVAMVSAKLAHDPLLRHVAGELRDFATSRRAPTGQAVIASARASVEVFHAGHYDLAETLLKGAETSASGLAPRSPAVEARVLQARAARALVRGDPLGFLELMARCAASFDEAGNLRASCSARVFIGYGHLEMGEHEEARRCLVDALPAAERMGLEQIVAAAKQNLGLTLARLGVLDRARAIETEAVESFRAHGDCRMEGASRIYLAIIHLVAGDLTDATTEATRVARGEAAPQPLRAFALGVLSSARLRDGDTETALSAAREATMTMDALGGLDEGESIVRLAYAEALHAAGDVGAAREAIGLARARLLDRAARFTDPARRDTFLNRVPENARTLAHAHAWCGPAR